jgi:hypothetical protein
MIALLIGYETASQILAPVVGAGRENMGYSPTAVISRLAVICAKAASRISPRTFRCCLNIPTISWSDNSVTITPPLRLDRSGGDPDWRPGLPPRARPALGTLYD